MKLFKQLFCTHYWVDENNLPGRLIPKKWYISKEERILKSPKQPYFCTKCGKIKFFEDMPVNYIE